MIERETNYKKDLKVILQTFNCNSIDLKISKSFTFDSNYFFRFLFAIDPCREKMTIGKMRTRTGARYKSGVPGDNLKKLGTG